MTTHAESEPAWDIARLFPDQGAWSEEEYFALPGDGLVEYSHGRIEVLPMPSESHQLLVLFLYRTLLQFITRAAPGTVLVAPLRVQLWPGKYREPDLVFMLREHAARRGERYWRGADLVMEVISPDDPLRDTVTKRREYAEAGIPEYWLIDPVAETVTVFVLETSGQPYRIAGEFRRGEQAGSSLLDGFTLDVAALFDEARNA